jgi:hypothetical protein
MITDLRQRTTLARELMDRFALATGLDGEASPRRYLWTDAFAVCNFLGLHRATGEGRYRELALRLVDQVHHVLGRHRPDDERRGWLSGLSTEEGERHPTCGGLRIGKPLPERAPSEPLDPQLEWDRDGQYFHYLTQWMHALSRVGAVIGEPLFHRWAVELARAAHAGFVHPTAPGGPRRMVWKMSVGLDRPLVSSMGQHDPLDAWVSYLELQAEGAAVASAAGGLEHEISEVGALVDDRALATDDALGIGALLVDAHRLATLIARHGVAGEQRFDQIVEASLVSLGVYARRNMLDQRAEHRLAFRELGLAIGLHAAEAMHAITAGRDAFPAGVAALASYLPLGERIEDFWSEAAHREATTWSAHADINSVMLATSLAPAGYLGS